MWLLSLVFGSLVGFSLGLTGGGGAIFAVPLLVYGVGLPAREAVGVSLVTVGATSAAGFLQRWRLGLVEFPTGLLFAVAGMIGAPLGAALAERIPNPVLLGLFSILMVVVAVRIWRKAGDATASLPVIQPIDEPGPTCRRDPEGVLRLTSRCAMLLAAVGLATGVLSGLFGVGGGFIIVPALVLFSGMGIQRAVGTSLLVITLVSISGTASFWAAGQNLPLQTVLLFTAGGVAGLLLGAALARRLAGAVLQRVFAAAILAVAGFVLVHTLLA
jgi:uncharacterized membrane protein YfcA